MSAFDTLFLIVVLLGTAIAAPFLGRYMYAVFEGKKHPLSFMAPIEMAIYRLLGVRSDESTDWKTWAKSVLIFSLASFALLFAILIGQQYLPLNPQNYSGQSLDLAFNTSVSFMTNTNWQAYSGEASLSYFSQMVGLAVQNFLSPAIGMAVALAMVRGFRNRKPTVDASTQGLGNLWVDLTRTTLYILLPLSIIVALILVSQGVIQNFAPYQAMTSLGGKADLIPMGPAASQIAIKQLGTNGGGFFGVNSLHPFENPTGISNLVELISIILIPMAIPFMYGRMLGRPKQGYALFAAMAILFGLSLTGAIISEVNYGTLEGKDLRFSQTESATWAIATTVTSNGSVNAQHDSMSPLAGGLAMLNIMLGEVVFGGIGSGLYGMLAMILITVFLVGLMVGRMPEFLGKKIEAREIILSAVVIIVPSVSILIMAAISIALPIGLGQRANIGPHGLSEILYAYSSGFGNNGSAFGGLSANTPFYNLMIGFAMLIGRFAIIFPVLAIGGSFANKKTVAENPASFQTGTALFAGLLVAMILIVGALTHFPALALGPVLDHYLMLGGIHL